MFFKTMLRPLRKLSIQIRLTLVYVTIFGTSLVVFGVGTFEYLATSLQKEFDDALYNYAVDITESIFLDPSGDLNLAPPQLDKLKIYPFSLGTALIQIRHRSGKIIEQVGKFGHLDLPYARAIERLSKGDDAFYQTLERIEGLPQKEAESYRVINFAVDTSETPQLLLQVAVPRTLLENQIQNRKLVFEFGIPTLLILATFLTYWLSFGALKPVRQMIQRSREISVSNLSQRLPIPEAQDEIQQLALTLNDMIGRLQSAFQSQDRFIADASHQLLTPLTILKGELEQGQRSMNFSQDQIPSLLQEVDRLTRLVQDLLLLARVSAGAELISLAPTQMEDAVIDALARADKIARQKKISLDFQIQDSAQRPQPPLVNGSEELLSHLVFNLVENGLKYSPPESHIQVGLEYSSDRVLLSVKDQGPGIPNDEFENIFERFRRGKKNTAQMSSGYGLGLSIATEIAKLHGGRIWAKNSANTNPYRTGAEFYFEIKII